MNGKNGKGRPFIPPRKGSYWHHVYGGAETDVVSLWWPLHKNCWHTLLLSRTKAKRQKKKAVIFRARYDSYFPTQRGAKEPLKFSKSQGSLPFLSPKSGIMFANLTSN